MAKRTRTVETACPHCGHSPIPDDAERCPGCYRPLKSTSSLLRHNDREVEPIDAQFGTRIGGLDLFTSDAEAHPGTLCAALCALGLYAGAAGLGALPLPGEPNGYLLLGTANLALAILLGSAPGFARPLIIVSSPLQVLTWLYLGRHGLPSATVIGVALTPLAILAGVTGATGPRRRSLVLAAVLALTTFSAAARIAARRRPGPRIALRGAGLHMQLPSGFEVVSRPARLTTYLPMSGIDPRLQTLAFGDPTRRIGGFWSVSAPGQVGQVPLAESVARLIDGQRGVMQPAREGLRALLTLPQSGWQIPLHDGRAASATAIHLPSGQTALLVLAAPSSELESARQALAQATTFSTAPIEPR